jgi:hypothetical protein
MGITKSEFNRYRKVQHSGRFNMIMQAHDAAIAANLSPEKYRAICQNYSALSEKYPEKTGNKSPS